MHERARRPDRAEAGFTLIEVIVALALFLVLASAVLAVLAGAQTLGRDAKYRSVAIELAHRELEITRDAFTAQTRGPTTIETNQVSNPNPLAGQTDGDPLVVNKVPYTIARNAQWAQMGSSAATTCDEGSSVELSYLRVWVEVRWPGLGSRPPVRMDTVMTPPKGTYSQLSGHVGVKVISASGGPLQDVPVSISGPSGNQSADTTSDGCALFAFLSPGTYSVSLSKPGYVTRNGSPSAAASAQVQAGQLWRTVVEYDEAAALTVTFTTVSGYSLPTGNTLPVTLGNSALVPSGARSVAGGGNTRTLSNLWAYPSGYQVWAGSCLDNDPQFNGGSRDLPVAVSPGGISTATLALEPVRVTGAPSNRTVVATQSSDSSCASGQSITLGTSAGDGSLMTSLPLGDWRITSGSRSGNVSVDAGGGAESVGLS